MQDWQTVDPANFQISINGGKPSSLDTLVEAGSYAVFMKDSPLYDVDDKHSALESFKAAFPGGFAWEVLEVFSGKKDSNNSNLNR